MAEDGQLLRPIAHKLLIVWMMGGLALVLVVGRILGRVWTRPGHVAPWLVLITGFAGTPIVFVRKVRLQVELTRITFTYLFGASLSVDRRLVAGIALDPPGLFLLGQGGARLLNVRTVWSKSQLTALSQVLHVPIEGLGSAKPPRAVNIVTLSGPEDGAATGLPDWASILVMNKYQWILDPRFGRFTV
jgi:hypothetical protein